MASLELTNEWMISSCAGLFQRMAAPAKRVFLDAEMSMDELDELVMVGGSSHMPAVRQYISRLLGRKPAEDSRPDTAIALGAGICAGMKSRAADLRELVLTDVCPFTLGVAVLNTADPERPIMSSLIERNCVLPSSREDVFSTAYEGQEEVMIEVYQGENLYCRDNTFLGKLRAAVPRSKQGRQPVRVRFTYDINGLLEVEAATGSEKPQRLVIKNDSMSDQEAERRLQELSALKSDNATLTAQYENAPPGAGGPPGPHRPGGAALCGLRGPTARGGVPASGVVSKRPEQPGPNPGGQGVPGDAQVPGPGRGLDGRRRISGYGV